MHRCLILAIPLISLLGCTRADAERRAREAADAARERAGQAFADAETLVQATKDVKAEYDKLMPSTTEYDLVFAEPEEGSDRLKEHDARLKTMDRVEVEGITVGYEERKDRSLGGTAFERHFRATWAYEGRVLAVSYYSKKQIDAVAFQELLQKLVPASNQVFKHVKLKRGER